ncbi:rap guanine nucleotide exchange factor 2 isoform X3 [Contarinia nasturtii]|uniref:rap guanine nucleotide exchange factor 2 isoform X3 n=1 Tax=Contarinia nasturtii TaxID=265458 RepID=UPI0012D46B4C|nr:rap guanine nucleotide exchange factor 2 isoform X3 [Contarinia nasturtii]
MLKHYYVSPKKRSKSQSSEASDGSDTATSCIEHHEYLTDFMRATKNISRKAFHSFHEITSSEPNVSIASSHTIQASVVLSASADPSQHDHENSHSSENTTPIQTPQKSYETRLTRMRLAHAFSTAVTYSRSRFAHLPSGTSFCSTHIGAHGIGNAEPTSTSGLTPPVRRWNSFHSTRGECHPNKFRRERKSTSPSIVISRRNGDGFRQLSECFVSETQEILATDESEIGSVAAEAASKIDDLIRHDNNDEEIEDVEDIDAIIGVAIPKPKIMDPPLHHTLHSSQTALSANVKRFGSGRPELYQNQKCNRGSHSSDTSSAYSGSDTMTSVHSSSLDADEVDLSGLVESVVDSDEEDLAESMDSLAVRDTVRECLEKDPTDRTEEDIETLLEFTKNLQAFTNMTLAVRRALCSVMVFAVVEKAGTTVMNDGEELDSWSVLINGHVEVEYANGETDELQVGDSFGILPTMDKLYHKGVMKTKCDDCQFVCITQTDYYRIQHQGEENTKRHEENGQLVMVTELRHGTMEGNVRRGHVVIRGTPERLMVQLIEENSMTDPTYVEDFLLTHRTFITCSQNVLRQLLQWFESESTLPSQTTASPVQIRDRVTRVILLWVNNHFTDFETDPHMMKYLEQFESGLESKNMHDQIHLLHIACAAKARTRVVTLARSSRDEDLHFSIIGGYEKGGCGIFISNVDKKTKPEDVGLKRGDQILEVNGNSFEHMKLARALELMTGTTHLCITVKSNLLAFKEMLQTPDNNSPRPRSGRRTVASSELARLHSQNSQRVRLSSADLLTSSTPFDQTDHVSATNSDSTSVHMPFSSNLPPTAAKKDSATSISSSHIAPPSSASKSGFMTLGPKRRLQKALIKMNLYPKNSSAALLLDTDDQETQSASSSPISTTSPSNGPATTITTPTPTGSIGSNCSIATSTTSSHTGDSASLANVSATNKTSGSNLYHSQSNPDLTTIYYEDLRASDYPEHVLKVYKADQSCKYLLVHKETTAHEVVMLALQEFGIHETSSNFSLCEVSVGEGGMIKQRRLPDQLPNLAERIGLSARYYLKTNGITETLVPDDMAPELVRESAVYFLQLNANEVAIQLTVQDYAIFRQIESTEYVDDLFEIQSNYGVPMLKKFSELVNKEMFWVVTEVCSEYNMVRRMKIVKQFIKIARHCKECQNFNSMFAILSGLGHAAVSRLRLTWEKLPSKYQKLFNDLQELMDPSRNMSKYRQLVLTELNEQHPIIPFYPVVKKDLTFIHLGNDTYVESLVNFEKLRMIAKEIRSLTYMCSSPYDLLTMLEMRGQPPSAAMVALNQMVHNVQNIHPQKSHTHSHTHSSGMSALASTLGALAVSASGQATVKRRKKSAAAPNPKKMFEEAQMVRRVKAYLNNIKVITDEDNLHQLSLECEQSGGSAPSSVTIRKRHPSPTLSTTSSTSSTSEGKKVQMAGGVSIITNNDPHDRRPPKFGAASPQAVKKLLSLSEQTKTRPHQPRHFNNLMTHVGTGNTTNTFGMCANTTTSIGLVAADTTLRQSSGLPSLYYHHNSGLPTLSSSPSPTPSPNALRTQSSVPYSAHNYGFGNQTTNVCANNTGIACLPTRAVHERSHSDGTTAPLPSVDLSMESSSVTSLSNLPLRKHPITAHNVGINGPHLLPNNAPHVKTCTNLIAGSGNGAINSAGVGNRLQQVPPAYNVAAQRALLHRLGRAHSHEGVTSSISISSAPLGFYQPNTEDTDDDGAQVSAV